MRLHTGINYIYLPHGRVAEVEKQSDEYFIVLVKRSDGVVFDDKIFYNINSLGHWLRKKYNMSEFITNSFQNGVTKATEEIHNKY